MAMNLKIPFLEVDIREFIKKQAGKIKLRVVGLFIGKEFVDLIEMRRTFNGPRVVNFVSVPIGVRAVTSEVPQELSSITPSGEGGPSAHEQILLAIRKAVRESGLHVRKVVSTLSEEEVIVRYFQMPQLPKKEWNQAIRFEARKYIPFTLDELVSDFSVVADKKEKGKVDVVFVAAKKEVIARHLALLTKAGLQVSHLEALPFSFLRLLDALDPTVKKEKCVCVVDIDGISGNIILIKEGLPYLVRRISLEISSEEDAFRREQSSQEGPSHLPPFVEKLLDEVRLTLRYYQNQFPGESVSRILLFGDNLTEVSALLSKELSLPVHMEDLSQFVGGKEMIPLRLARTIGLGLRGLTKGDTGIELLPRKESVPSQQARLVKISLLEIVGAVAVLLGLFFILSYSIDIQKRTLEKENSKQKIVTSLSKTTLEEKKKTLSQKANLYRNLFEKRIFWTKKLSQLGNILPKGAWVTRLKIEDHSDGESSGESRGVTYGLNLTGSVYAPDKAEELRIPSQFLAAIQQNADFFEGFTEAKLVSVKRDSVEGVGVTSFEIMLTGGR